MKTKVLTSVCIAALACSTIPRGWASDTSGSAGPNSNSKTNHSSPGPFAVAVDTVVVRPACLAATIVGSALFVVALPVAATSHSVKKAADALVTKPARATFKRPLGDLDGLMEEDDY